jgi:hypothetical protein
VTMTRLLRPETGPGVAYKKSQFTQGEMGDATSRVQ